MFLKNQLLFVPKHLYAGYSYNLCNIFKYYAKTVIYKCKEGYCFYKIKLITLERVSKWKVD